MTYNDYVIYVDESGDHTLTAIDRDYPVFVLLSVFLAHADTRPSPSRPSTTLADF